MTNTNHITKTKSKSKSKQLLGIFTLTIMSTWALATNWNVEPLRVDLSPIHKTAVLTITNSSDQPSTVQILSYIWSQDMGKDEMVLTRELLVTPPIVTIPAKSSQVVRMALRVKADKSKELSYRVNLQEIPSPNPNKEKNAGGVQVAMRVGIPVFVQPQGQKAVSKLSWRATAAPENMIKLELINEGTAHIKVTDLILSTIGSEVKVAQDSGASYVLPGQTHTWMLKPITSAKVEEEHLHLLAYTDAVDLDTVIFVDKP
jgi:fimbrial chaperone protein